MSLPVFPVLPGLTFTVLKTPEFNTLDMKSPNGYEVRIRQTINPIWSYQFIYDFLHDFPWGSFTTVSELRTMMDFFNSVGGKAGSFLFSDPDDNYVGPAMNGSSPNTPFAQLQLVTDGNGNYYSPIQRTLGGTFYEDITDLDGSIAVYANGVLQSGSSYSVNGPGLALPNASYMGLYLKWGAVAMPSAPSLSSVSGGTLAATTYYVKIAYVGSGGTSAASAEASLAVAADNLLSVMSPPASNGATGYNVYVTTASGTETLQNASPISIGTNWTEPTSGLVSGTAAPIVNTTQPTQPITAQFNYYFRVRFDSDSQDFEKFMNVGMAAVTAGQGGGYWTIGGSNSQNGNGTLKLTTARPTPL